MSCIEAQISFTIDQQTWMFVGLGSMALFYVFIRSKGRKRRDPLDASGERFSISRERNTERQMQNLLVDLSEMARQISAQLDTRAAKLETLIREADEKIAALRQMSPSAPDPMRLPRHDSDADTGPIPIDPRHAEIYHLADDGRTPAEIANQLKRPSGEIELILALRRKG